MIRPPEMELRLPMLLTDGVVSSTTKVWETLTASHNGNLERVKQLVNECPELAYAQYNYTPPIHFAVREAHVRLVEYLLEKGALDPAYITYPFKDTLLMFAEDRGHQQIASLLRQYLNDPSMCKYKGDNGEIRYDRSDLEKEFQNAVDKEDLEKARKCLQDQPGLVNDPTFFWGEGIMMMPAKDGNKRLLELLLGYGAKVPPMSKWGRFYYFKHYPIAAFLMENGMDANHHTWHHVTLLHDMAQEGDIQKATLLLQHGAEINTLEDEYQSTPLGLAARWGRNDIVELLLQHGADPNKAGASWATPLAWALKKQHHQVERTLRNAGAHR